MRKLGLLLWMLAFTAVGAQAQNIIKSLERTVPGQGKVTIHQDPKICLLYTSIVDNDPSAQSPENEILWRQLKSLRKTNVNWAAIS